MIKYYLMPDGTIVQVWPEDKREIEDMGGNKIPTVWGRWVTTRNGHIEVEGLKEATEINKDQAKELEPALFRDKWRKY